MMGRCDAPPQPSSCSEDLGPPGRDDHFGVGRIDLARAVGTAPSGTPTSTEPVTTPPTAPAPPVSAPGPLDAARFTAKQSSAADPPVWLVVIAAAALFATATAWHRTRRPPE